MNPRAFHRHCRTASPLPPAVRQYDPQVSDLGSFFLGAVLFFAPDRGAIASLAVVRAADVLDCHAGEASDRTPARAIGRPSCSPVVFVSGRGWMVRCGVRFHGQTYRWREVACVIRRQHTRPYERVRRSLLAPSVSRFIGGKLKPRVVGQGAQPNRAIPFCLINVVRRSVTGSRVTANSSGSVWPGLVVSHPTSIGCSLNDDERSGVLARRPSCCLRKTWNTLILSPSATKSISPFSLSPCFKASLTRFLAFWVSAFSLESLVDLSRYSPQPFKTCTFSKGR